MDRSQEFIEAVKTGEQSKVAALLESEPDLATARTDAGVSALLLAVYYGHPEVAELLIARRSELDIFEASATSRAEVASRLLEADPGLANAFSPDGFPPLGLAAFFGHPEVVDLLLQREANPNAVAQNAMRVMPLHSAAAHSQADRAFAISRMLIEHGAQVNATQEGGWTPLHEAANHGRVELARLLIDHGADVNSRSEDGSTPLQMAAKNGHSAVVDLLKAHGAA